MRRAVLTSWGIEAMERASQNRARKHATVLLNRLTTAIYRITDTYVSNQSTATNAAAAACLGV